MRFLVLALLSATLVGCGKAKAAAPDSNNPAHCLAAFNYDAYWFKVGNEPEKVAEYLARGVYVLDKVKSNGGSPANVLAESKQFSRAYVKDSKTMDALTLACSKTLALDPQFRADFGGLIEKVRPSVPQYEALTEGH